MDIAKIEPFEISRTFDAPRELVWRAWTEVEHLAQWSGPKDVSVNHATIDLRPGGRLHMCMSTPDGKDMWSKWEILEVDPPDRLVYIQSFSDPQGGKTRHPLAADWPLETLTKITLVEAGAKTTLHLAWIPVNATPGEIAMFAAGKAGMAQGWAASFDKLAAFFEPLTSCY